VKNVSLEYKGKWACGLDGVTIYYMIPNLHLGCQFNLAHKLKKEM